ncbi:hypothetical protein [Desulfosporosinus metallidurans]|uniref:hypothetical protein n=1 Tax=Desulfosporosinus metallidurans TaxID=1888891 RepID=UPI00094D1635|nr:hypothetical protein [Desulfosporosinus metallidurans]
MVSDPEVVNGDLNLCTYDKKSVMEMGSIKIVEVDENFRFLTCPFCENTVFSHDARFCKRCGSELFNFCTNAPDSDSEWCGRPNVPDAFYCEFCGSITRIGQAANNNFSKEVAITINNDDNEPF